jgi:hypothetical protein
MTVDPTTNLDNYIKQWNLVTQQYTNDHAALEQMLADIIKRIEHHDTQGAFQIAEMGVMPSAMQLQGDTMGKLASSMNIGSACQEITTAAQNLMNAGSNITPDQANKFVQYLKDFYSRVNIDLTVDANKWLDQNTKTNLLQSINQICQTFGVQDPSKLDGTTVKNAIIQWSTHPTDTTLPNKNTGQQNLQNLQSGFTQWNNVESAQSQGLQAQEQFAANTFNQYMNATTNIFQSSQQQAQNMVQNQKSQ